MFTRLLTLFAIVLVAASLVGCKTVVSGSGTSYVLKRDLTNPRVWVVDVGKDIHRVHNAAMSGMRGLGVKPFNSSVDDISGIVEGAFADGTDFQVRLASTTSGITKIKISVGITSDRVRAEQIFRAIEENL